MRQPSPCIPTRLELITVKKLLVSTLVASTAFLLPTAHASAQPLPDNARPLGCINESWYDATQIGAPKYEAVGPAAGKHNASTATEELSVGLNITTSKSTTVSAGISGGVDWGIATVEAHADVSVDKTTSSGYTTNDQILVPGGKYGYATAKIERTTFEIDHYSVGNNCQQTKSMMGYVYAITAFPFYSECIAAGRCTPTP